MSFSMIHAIPPAFGAAPPSWPATWVKIHQPGKASRPRPKARASKRTTTDLCGTAATFTTLSSPIDLSPAIASAVGCDRAPVALVPGCFDRCLARCEKGRVKYAVEFQLAHEPDLKLCSTISGALRLWADRESLYFYITGSIRDGRHAVKWARRMTHLRKCSVMFAPERFDVERDRESGAVNAIYVTRAALGEVSLVESGAFRGTSIEFL